MLWNNYSKEDYNHHDVPVMISFRQGTSLRSYMGVTTPSNVPNMLPSPRVSNIQKNRVAHNWEIGNISIASVKAINVSPGPDATYIGIKYIIMHFNTFE